MTNEYMDILIGAVTAARVKAESALAALKASVGEAETNRTVREVSATRLELLRANHRLSEFLNRGVVPEDLKQHGKRQASYSVGAGS